MYWRLRLLSATLFAGVVSRSVSECNRAHRAVRNLRVDRVAMLFLVESELLDPVAQRAERHAEQFRGAGFVVARLLQRFADRVPLFCFHLRPECGLALRFRPRRRWRT